MRRPPLDEDMHEIIVAALRRGHFVDTAASLAGCTSAQINRWIRNGAQDGADPDLRRFAIDCRRAIAECEDEAVKFILATGDLKAVTWWLERRHPERWGAKVQHIVRAEVDGILERLESLEGELGAEVVDRVLSAVAGEWGSGEGEAEAEAGEGLH